MIAPNLLKVMHSQAYRNKQSRITKEYYKSLENRQKTSTAIKTAWTKEKRLLQSKRAKAEFRNPKTRNKISKSLKRTLRLHPRTPEIRDKIDRAVTRWWNDHPNIKKKKAEYFKKFFTEHSDEFRKKFMNGKNNPFKPHIKTKLGLVRSQGEKIIANYLTENNIKADYEAKPLLLSGHVCVPDFYLTKYQAYIEFYGGYPDSWKKKVLKNNLYKKYHINVISITPSELNKLDEVINF